MINILIIDDHPLVAGGIETMLKDAVGIQIQWIAKIIGFAITIGVTIYITRVAKKALDETLAE